MVPKEAMQGKEWDAGHVVMAPLPYGGAMDPLHVTPGTVSGDMS